MFYLIINSIYHLNMKTYVVWDITRLLGSGTINVRGGPVEHLFMGLLVVWRCKSLCTSISWVISIMFGHLCASTLWNLGIRALESVPHHLWFHLGPPGRSVMLCS